MIKLFRRDGLHCQPRFTPPKNSLAAVPRNNKLRLRYEIIEANYSLTLSLNGVSYVLPHKDIKFVGNGYAALISFIEETEVERAKLESLSAVELEERKNLISSMTVNLFDDVDDVIVSGFCFSITYALLTCYDTGTLSDDIFQLLL